MLAHRTLTSLARGSRHAGRPSLNSPAATSIRASSGSSSHRSHSQARQTSSQNAPVIPSYTFRNPSSTHSSYAALAALAVIGATTASFIGSPLRADADPIPKQDETSSTSSSSLSKGNPAFSKEQLGVICIIGGPAAGKSTQVENVAKRFDLTKIDASGDVKAQLQEVFSKSPSKGNKKRRVVLENFPQTLDQANKFQEEICPILLIIFIDLESEKALKRIQDEVDKRDAKINWKRFEEKSKSLIKQFRFQGNFLEITGEWPKDEVWEQVEAKLESALELDDRGEL